MKDENGPGGPTNDVPTAGATPPVAAAATQGPVGFLVYIVESPSAIDLYHKRYEGEALGRALDLALVPAVHRLVVTEEAFRAAFLVGLKETLDQHPRLLPVLHLSAHGNEAGIQLTDGTRISWDALREILMPVNKALNGMLVVCMSSCQGGSGCMMAMEEGELPFHTIIGSFEKPTWADTTVAFMTFYHQIQKGTSVADALAAMQAASGAPFNNIGGGHIQQRYLSRLQAAVKPEQAEAAMANEVENAGTPSLEKALS